VYKSSSGITLIKSVFVICLSILFVNLSFPASTLSQGKKEQIASKMERVNLLRASGEFDKAISLLNDIIKEYSSSEKVLRYAYNHLVFTYNSMERKQIAISTAKEALELYPDLKVETPDIPPSIDKIYNNLRKEMFGSLKISSPEDCHVFLIQDSVKVFEGATPLFIPYVRAGKYTLQVTKSGYHDHWQKIDISADENYNRDDIPLSRDRGRKWWLMRVLPAAIAGSLTAILLWPEDDETNVPGPLASPPKPPGQ